MRKLRLNALPCTELMVADVIDILPDAVPNANTTSHDTNIASSSVCNMITTIHRATSPILGHSNFVDNSTSILPNKIFNSPEKEHLRKQLESTKNFYQKKIKYLQQKVRRKKSQIVSLNAILKLLKEKNCSLLIRVFNPSFVSKYGKIHKKT